MEAVFAVVILIFSVVFHEVSHGLMAHSLGDDTAKDAGRLTLNPIPHLDLVGSILLPGFFILLKQFTGTGIVFGWAKPVPINPYNFRDQKYGAAKVAMIGPVANLFLAVVFGLALRFVPAVVNSPLATLFSYIVYINIVLAVFNLVPIPPLDGHHVLFTFLRSESTKRFLYQNGFLLLLFIMFFFFNWISLVAQWIFALITGMAAF